MKINRRKLSITLHIGKQDFQFLLQTLIHASSLYEVNVLSHCVTIDHVKPYEMALIFLKMLFLVIYPFFLLSINNKK